MLARRLCARLSRAECNEAERSATQCGIVKHSGAKLWLGKGGGGRHGLPMDVVVVIRPHVPCGNEKRAAENLDTTPCQNHALSLCFNISWRYGQSKHDTQRDSRAFMACAARSLWLPVLP
eukprot:74627-Chlamydomonas_euryale.AAC.6